MTMVSVTEIEGWRRCRRKSRLTSLNHMGYTPIWPKMNTLGIGSLVHIAGESWLNNPQSDFGECFWQAGKDLYVQLTNLCEAKHYKPTDKQEDEFWEAITLGRHMCVNYQAYYKTPLPANYELVRPEQQCVVPIPNTLHCECKTHDAGGRCSCLTNCSISESSCTCLINMWLSGSDSKCSCIVPHYLEGTLDAIIGDAQGHLFVYERKTFGQHPDIRHLNRAFQFIAYDWILHEAIKYWGTSNEVYGVLYDGLWKRSAPPTTGKWKDNAHSLFVRHYVLHNQETLDEFEQELTATVLEMTNPSVYITHTVPAVKGCVIDCDLMDVCDMMTKGEDTSLLLKLNYTRRDMTPAFKEFYAQIGEPSE